MVQSNGAQFTHFVAFYWLVRPPSKAARALVGDTVAA